MPVILGIDYQLDQTNTAPEVGGGSVPVGTISSLSPGYFTNTSNGGFTVTGPAGNSVADVNQWLADNYPGWAVCNGAEVEDENSPIWDSPGRYLPDLTNGRFASGATSAGVVGGANTKTLSSNNLPKHNHNENAATNNADTHTHNFNNSTIPHQHRYYSPGSNALPGWQVHQVANIRGGVNGNSYSTNPGMGNANTNMLHAHGNTSIGESDHSHNVSGSLGNAGSSSAFNITPTYLNTFYIIRFT